MRFDFSVPLPLCAHFCSPSGPYLLDLQRYFSPSQHTLFWHLCGAHHHRLASWRVSTNARCSEEALEVTPSAWNWRSLSAPKGLLNIWRSVCPRDSVGPSHSKVTSQRTDGPPAVSITLCRGGRRRRCPRLPAPRPPRRARSLLASCASAASLALATSRARVCRLCPWSREPRGTTGSLGKPGKAWEREADAEAISATTR